MRFLAALIAISLGLIGCRQNPKACVEMEEIYEVNRGYTLTSCSEGYEFITWEFGDGGGFLGEDAPKTYRSVGDYTVTVTAYADGGYIFDEATANIRAANRIWDRFIITGNSVYDEFRIVFDEFSAVYPNATGNFTREEPYEGEFEEQMRAVLPLEPAQFSLIGLRDGRTPIRLIDFESINYENNLDNPVVFKGKGFELTVYWVYN
ncbi:MAG: hypothetical protein Salg2KO_19500 [Salibacteraceae bacterium]